VPGDAGLGPGAQADLLDAILAVVGRAKIAPNLPEGSAGSGVPTALLPPEVADSPGTADETKRGWQILQGPGFTLGLPPGLRAMRLDMGVAAPRPISAGEVVWNFV
jgi:hypothetical protein